LTFEITLPNSSDITITSDLTKSYTYTLSNIQLEFESIYSPYLASEAISAYNIGKGIMYENILLHKTFTINKATDSVINEMINVPRRSMTGLMILFQPTYLAGARDSEKFINPDIKSIHINIDGLPNKLYSSGMVPTDFWQSILKRFALPNNMTQKEFYHDKFALWLDLRTYHDDSIHGNGLLVNSVKDGIKIQISRKVGGVGTITAYLYIVSDGLLEIQDGALKAILY